jgi:LemA protein
MKKWLIVLIVIVGIIAIIGMSLAGAYNGLVSSKENLDRKFADIDVALKRRTDLIPNLVNTVKGFAAHETEAIASVTDARARMAGARTTSELADADSELSGALSRLLVVVENYPELKADANFRQLSDELTGTENRIAVSRGDYNAAAQNYNMKIRSFPLNLIAGMMGFEKTAYFEADAADRTPPTVDFGGQ